MANVYSSNRRVEALLRIAALYGIEAGIRGSAADRCLAMRRAQSAPLVADLEAQLHAQLSRGINLAEAIRYGLRHWQGLSDFLVMAVWRWLPTRSNAKSGRWL